MSHYLISGGAGFVGSHLTDRLARAGHSVTVLDTFVTGRRENIETRQRDSVDVREHDAAEPFTPSTEPDRILHLASIAAPDAYQSNPIQTLRCGSDATSELLDLARRYDATYLFTSTSEVYGNPEVHPQPETYSGNVNPYGPRSCYDESKRYAEALIRAYREQHGVDTRIVRIFNTYGPRCRDSRVIPTFVRQAMADEPLTVHGDGTQTRSFCYISDLLDGLMATLRSNCHEPVNLGNPDERTINELAQIVVDLIDSDSSIEYADRPIDDPDRRCPDITKARRRLDWGPSVSLRDGLRQTIQGLS